MENDRKKEDEKTMIWLIAPPFCGVLIILFGFTPLMDLIHGKPDMDVQVVSMEKLTDSSVQVVVHFPEDERSLDFYYEGTSVTFSKDNGDSFSGNLVGLPEVEQKKGKMTVIFRVTPWNFQREKVFLLSPGESIHIRKNT